MLFELAETKTSDGVTLAVTHDVGQVGDVIGATAVDNPRAHSSIRRSTPR